MSLQELKESSHEDLSPHLMVGDNWGIKAASCHLPYFSCENLNFLNH